MQKRNSKLKDVSVGILLEQKKIEEAYKEKNRNRYNDPQILYRPPKNSLSNLVLENEIEILKVKLLEIDPNERDVSGYTASWTPLYWSVKLNRVECVRLLLEGGADINMVVNDIEECCGTVLDLATLRGDDIMENLLREYAVKDEVNFGQAFKAIRTKLRGKAPAFNFRYCGKARAEDNSVANTEVKTN